DEGTAVEDLLAHAGPTLTCGEDEPVADAAALDRVLELAPHGSVADQYDLEVEPLRGEKGGGLHEQQLPFLFAHPRNADEPRLFRHRRGRRAKQVLLHSAPDHFELLPVLGTRPAAELAAPEAAHGHADGRPPDLFAQPEELGFVELLG